MGTALLPRKPSWTRKFRETTTIVNQRAQLCALSSPRPAAASSTPQSNMIQPQPVRSTSEEARPRDDEVLVVEQSDQALNEVDRADDQHQDAGEADPPCHALGVHLYLRVGSVKGCVTKGTHGLRIRRASDFAVTAQLPSGHGRASGASRRLNLSDVLLLPSLRSPRPTLRDHRDVAVREPGRPRVRLLAVAVAGAPRRAVDDADVSAAPGLLSAASAGGEWLLVGLGVALDLATYAAKPAQSRYATG